MKSNSVTTKYRIVKTTALTFAGTGILALALLPAPVVAQMRGMQGGSYGSGGHAAPSYSMPSYSRPSYSAPSYTSPTYSRPSYTPAQSPAYTRPNYSPSYSPSTGGAGQGTARTGADFNSVFQRSTPTYNYNSSSLTSPGYRIQQTPGQGAGQYQNNRPVTTAPGTSAIPNRAYTQYPLRQMPLPNAGQLRQSRPSVNGIWSNPGGGIRYGNGGNGYANNGGAYNGGFAGGAYRYQYGVPHGSHYFYGDYGFSYFSGGLAYYPYYSPFYSFGYSALSPYAFYDSFPSFITLGSVYAAPPQYVYVPYPVYQNGAYQGYRSEDIDGYYLNRGNGSNGAPAAGDNQYRVGEGGKGIAQDTALDATLNDIRDAWRTGKIDTLAKHVRRDAKVAVYLRGKYQYSLDSGDYLDITRDALSATKTVRFELDKVQRKEKGVYTVTGRHIYRDKDNNEHTVFVTYVLEKADTDYVITQVGSAPEKVDE